MDIVDLLLLLIFIGFPLLQFVLERLGVGGRGRNGEAPPEEEQEEETRMPRAERPIPPPAPPAPQRERALPPTREGGWSQGWGEWPAQTLEDLTAEEVVSEVEADELIRLQERISARESSEAARVTVPVVSLESLEVDRAGEHRRFHARTDTPPRPARVATAVPLRRALRNSGELRRAVVLAEILGPPPALRPPQA